jgi:hypothetical protein
MKLWDVSHRGSWIDWVLEGFLDYGTGMHMSERGGSVDSVSCPSLVDNTITSVIMKGDIAGKSNYEG